MGRARNEHHPAKAADGFASLLGPRRGSGRPSVEPADVLDAFLAGEARACAGLHSVHVGDGHCMLQDSDGRLLGRRRLSASRASIAAELLGYGQDIRSSERPVSVTAHKRAPEWLLNALAALDVGAELFDRSEELLIARLARFGDERPGLEAAGVERGRLLDITDGYLIAADWSMLQALERAGEPLAERRLLDRGGDDGWFALRAFGLIEPARSSGWRRWALSGDGRELLARRHDRCRQQTEVSSGPVASFLAELRGVDLAQARFSVTPADRDALGLDCERKLRDAGLGAQLERASLDLHELFVAQRFSPSPVQEATLRYALVALIGAGVLDERRRASLWNFVYNVLRVPLSDYDAAE